MNRILLIDDDNDLSETIKSVLEYAGYEALVSHTAQEGINVAKEQKPDLILMDVMLPDMNGAEAVHVLKSDPVVSNIPVIFLTGLVSENDEHVKDVGLNVDGVHYRTMAKPFENEKLLKEIKSVLEQKA